MDIDEYLCEKYNRGISLEESEEEAQCDNFVYIIKEKKDETSIFGK